MKAWLYIVLFAIALVVRLSYLAEWNGTPLASVLVGDAAGYDVWARAIVAGDWYGHEVFYQAPFYPYFLAIVYRVFGTGATVARLAQAVLGSASCVLLALAGRRFLSARAGLAAGALVALYAPAIWFDGLVQKGALGGFFMAILLWTLGEFNRRPRAVWIFAVGLTLGVFSLTRENALLLVPLVAAWVVLDGAGRSRRERAAGCAILLAGAALTLAPVGLRNRDLGGGFLLTTSQLGPNFFIGNHPGANGRYVPLRSRRGGVEFERVDATLLAEAATGRALSAREVSRYWLGRGLAYVRGEPLAWLGLMARKAGLVWHAGEILDTDSLEAYEDESRILRALGRVLHFGTLLPLALAGVWLTRGAWRRLVPLYAIALTVAASVALFYVTARYRYPLAPVLALFAGAGIVALFDLVRRRDHRALVAPAVLALAVAVPCNWPLRGDVDPRTITRFSLGSALVAGGRFDDGRREIERALALDPGFADAYYALGDSWLRQGETERAAAFFERALAHSPLHPHAHVGLGMVRFRAGDLDAAERHFREALRQDPALAAAHNDLAAVLARRGRLDEAVLQLEESVRLDPSEPDARANLDKLRQALDANR